MLFFPVFPSAPPAAFAPMFPLFAPVAAEFFADTDAAVGLDGGNAVDVVAADDRPGPFGDPPAGEPDASAPVALTPVAADAADAAPVALDPVFVRPAMPGHPHETGH